MSQFDERISTLIEYCHALVDDMARQDDAKAAVDNLRGAHVMNAILDLRKAWSPEKQEEQRQKGIRKLERLRAA